jgi:predicted aspartyl protease
MPKCKICFLITALVVTSALARGVDRPDEIPFKLIQGFGIVVRGEIGSMRDMSFLLDTGAVPSAISQRAASQMGISGALGSLTLLSKDSQAEYATVNEVRFGWIRAVRLPMVVVDLTRLEQLLGTRIDAIIGLDALAGQDISIDYKHRKITRGLSGRARHVLPVETRSVAGAPYWVLSISLEGEAFHVLLDTGANDVALFAGHAPKSVRAVKSGTIAHESAAGEGKAIALPPMTLVLSGATFKNQLAVAVGEPPGAFREFDGVLGPTALGITRIELDWERKCLRWDTQ